MLKLQDFLMAIYAANGDSDFFAYYDQEEDDIVYISDYSDDDYDIDDIEEAGDRFIFMVSGYDLFDLHVHDRFMERLEGKAYHDFMHAFHGRGKYGRFKSLLQKYHLWDEFNQYEENQYIEYIRNWVNENHIQVEGLKKERIREITMDDYEVLYTLMKEVYDYHQLHRPDYFIGPFSFTKENMEWILNEGEYFGIVYEQDEKVVGYATYEFQVKHDTKKCHIHEIGITKDAQTKGIGKKLYRYIEEKAKENQAKVIELTAFTFNQSAIAFYEAQDMEASKIIYEKKIGD